MTYQRIRHSVDGAVATLELNRPAKRNALDDVTVQELTDAVRAAEADDAVRVILLRGAGPDFCAGADLAQMERIAASASPMDNLRDAEGLGALLVLMRRIGKPVVGAVHGHAVAGGAGLATACDIVLARDDARFGYPEVRIGFVPAMVMALLRRSVGEKVAFELVARGDEIDAEEARRLGLVNRVFPADAFEGDVAAYVRRLAARSPSALRLSKRLLYGMDGLSFEEAIARGAEVNALARLSADAKAGVRAFLDRSAERASGQRRSGAGTDEPAGDAG